MRPEEMRAAPAGHCSGPIIVGLVGALVILVLVLGDLASHGAPLVSLIQPGSRGPAAALLGHDFPEQRFPPIQGNDGQQFYAMARAPMHPSVVARSLDRPRYRLQRPGYPALAWLLHPSGGGNGLIIALLTANVAAVALVTGALASWALICRRSQWWGLVAALIPGAFVTVRISCADMLAAGLALAAAVSFLRRRIVLAAALAAAAALTKEPSLILVTGVALMQWRTRARDVVAVVAPAVCVTALLFIVLVSAFPITHSQYNEITVPLRGLADSATYWGETSDWRPALTVLATLLLSFAALRRNLASAFSLAVAAYRGMALVQSMGTLAFWSSAPRTLYPLALCTAASLLGRGRRLELAGAVAAVEGPGQASPTTISPPLSRQPRR